MDHFGLPQPQLNRNGVQTTLVQAAVIRNVASGIVPQRQNVTGLVPFNLMKSETLVWVMDGVDCLEVVARRERRGSSQGVSVRVARGVYYRSGTFRSRSVEWEEAVHQDTGLLGFTTKHLYFSGAKKKFRVRYDQIVDFEPFSDGLGLMRDAQTAKPQSFRTGYGWFGYNPLGTCLGSSSYQLKESVNIDAPIREPTNSSEIQRPEVVRQRRFLLGSPLEAVKAGTDCHALAVYEFRQVLLPIGSKSTVLLLSGGHGGQVRGVYLPTGTAPRRGTSTTGRMGRSRTDAQSRAGRPGKLLDEIQS